MSCSHKHGHNHANQHMHTKSHESLIANFEDPKRDLWQLPKLVLNLLGPIKDKSIIDIGVGSGYFANHFVNAGAIVTGADVDAKFLEHVKGRFSSSKNFYTHRLEFNDPKIAGMNFDIIFTSNTYHHIDNRVEYLKKLKFGLKKDGRIAILDFKKDDQDHHFGPPIHMRIDIDTVIQDLKLAGYSILSANNQDFPHQYFIIAKNN